MAAEGVFTQAIQPGINEHLKAIPELDENLYNFIEDAFSIVQGTPGQGNPVQLKYLDCPRYPFSKTVLTSSCTWKRRFSEVTFHQLNSR